jgi:methylenetetrahydrofolate dehydrogenase (NADP+)/methenyltetrahydrofolate cyclohydrolase
MSEIIDGKEVAKNIRDEVALEVESLCNKGIQPHLTVVLVGENPSSQVYVRMKEKACRKIGMGSETKLFPASITQEKLLDIVRSLNQDPKVHGILVQLPLPDHIDESTVLEAIDPSKDVDGFHPINVGRLTAGLDTGFVPATPSGIIELLLRYNIDPAGKHAVIVGRSNIVGKPLGMLFLRKAKGGNATVTFCHSRSSDMAAITRSADILVAAVGKPEIIKADMVKQGAVVIDVGVNRVDDSSQPKGYRLVGDVDFNGVKDKVSAITPVPGGVGPMTIALLLTNTLKACKQQTNQE